MGTAGDALLWTINYIPEFLVWIGGLAMALVYWDRDKRAAKLVLAVTIVLLLTTPVFGALYFLLPKMMESGTVRLSMRILGFLHSVLVAAAWALAFFAVFAGRKGDAAKRPEDSFETMRVSRDGAP